MRNENSRRLGIVLSAFMIILLSSSSLAFAGSSSKKNSFRKVIKSFFGKRHRCRTPKDGQVISWHTRGSHWHPREYSCRDHRAPDGMNNGDKLTWSENHQDWIDDYIRTEEVDANLVVSGFVQSLSTGFIFPDGTIQTTASQGVPGPIGPVGLQGEPGLPGATGEVGPQGEQGPAGADGADGAQGEQGIQGIAGATGAIGPQGPSGSDGSNGAQGPAGVDGAVGPTGATGPQGPAGIAGTSGAKGDQGIQGITGATGDQGIQGLQGPAGIAGAKGDQGIQGLQGATGAAGTSGIDGAKGEQGIQGIQGEKGDNGADGIAGPIGPKGDSGATGAAGITGAKGDAGVQGPQGIQGIAGVKGDTGAEGPAGSDATVEITAGVGLVSGVISSVGTINLDVGINAGQIPQLDSEGRLPASMMPVGSGSGSTQKIAYIKDIRPSGTSGGACTSGAWQTRELNTIEGDASIVSLAANSFTLQPGTYHIDGHAPAFVTSQHKAKIVDSGAGTDAIVGSTGFSHNTSPSITQSMLAGVLTLSAPTSFTVMHRCSSTHALGFGLASGFGSNEVYTQIQITKLE